MNRKYFHLSLLPLLLAVLICGCVPARAADGERRIPELALLTFAALGGSVGAVLGAHLFHHKISIRRKLHFFVTLYGSLLLHLALLVKLLLALW